MVWIEIGAWKSTRANYKSIVEARAAAIRKIDQFNKERGDGATPVGVLYPNKNFKGDEAIGVVIRHLGGQYAWHTTVKGKPVSQPLFKNGKIRRA